MEPENDGLEDDFPYNWVIFRFHVNLPGCIREVFLGTIMVTNPKECYIWLVNLYTPPP